MRRILLACIIFLFILPFSVQAASDTAPPVPDQGVRYMPEDTESFAEGLWSIVKDGISAIAPSLEEAGTVCASILGVLILISLVNQFIDSPDSLSESIGCIIISTLLLRTANSLIVVGIRTVEDVSNYGKLLVPALTGALATQGGVATSAALYVGTAFFSSLLSWAVSGLLRPMIYIYLAATIVHSLTEESIVSNLCDFIKWTFTWGLKIALYVFTGYITITGVISGSTDAARLKATKLTISGMVPVVGGIISDASEGILVSAGLVKSTIGVYGLLAISAVCIEPFLTIGVQYLLLKVTAAFCQVFQCPKIHKLLKRFSTTMGFVLAMIGAVCLMLYVSIVCFLKGVA